MTAVLFDAFDDEAFRRQQLYDGRIYVYAATESGQALCEFARQMCDEAFDPWFPPDAQHHLPVDHYISILKDLKPRFIHHPKCKELIPALLDELGCDLEHTYFDVPRLRTACAGDYLSSGLAYAFKPHRDTWYSTPMSQINWWLPVYPIDPDNTMAFHPAYWDRPVRNSSALFNYQDWNLGGRKAAANQVGKDTRVQSEALETLTDLSPEIRLVPQPGGVIVFSAAHLHSTVPNTTNQTRFSIDFRTVDARDTSQLRGAPNLDGLSTGTTMMDYLRCTDLSNFPREEIERHQTLAPVAEFPTPDDIVVAAHAE